MPCQCIRFNHICTALLASLVMLLLLSVDGTFGVGHLGICCKPKSGATISPPDTPAPKSYIFDDPRRSSSSTSAGRSSSTRTSSARTSSARASSARTTSSRMSSAHSSMTSLTRSNSKARYSTEQKMVPHRISADGAFAMRRRHLLARLRSSNSTPSLRSQSVRQQATPAGPASVYSADDVQGAIAYMKKSWSESQLHENEPQSSTMSAAAGPFDHLNDQQMKTLQRKDKYLMTAENGAQGQEPKKGHEFSVQKIGRVGSRNGGLSRQQSARGLTLKEILAIADEEMDVDMPQQHQQQQQQRHVDMARTKRQKSKKRGRRESRIHEGGEGKQQNQQLGSTDRMSRANSVNAEKKKTPKANGTTNAEMKKA